MHRNQKKKKTVSYLRIKLSKDKFSCFLLSLHLFPVVLPVFREQTFTTIWETLRLSQMHMVIQLGC